MGPALTPKVSHSPQNGVANYWRSDAKAPEATEALDDPSPLTRTQLPLDSPLVHPSDSLRGLAKGVGFALLSAVALSLSRLCLRSIAHKVFVLHALAVRSLTLAGLSSVALLLTRQPLRFEPRVLKHVALRSFVGNCGACTAALAVYWMYLGDATALLATAPLMTTLLGRLWLKEKTPSYVLFFGLLGVGGSAMVALSSRGGEAHENKALLGAFCAMLSSCLIAVSYCAMRRVGQKTPLMVMVFCFGSAGILFFVPSLFIWPVWRSGYEGLAWFEALALAGYGSAEILAQVLFHLTLRHSKVGVGAYFRHCDVFLCFIYQAAIFKHPVRLTSALGAALILGASVLMLVCQISRQRRISPATLPAIQRRPSPETLPAVQRPPSGFNA